MRTASRLSPEDTLVWFIGPRGLVTWMAAPKSDVYADIAGFVLALDGDAETKLDAVAGIRCALYAEGMTLSDLAKRISGEDDDHKLTH